MTKEPSATNTAHEGTPDSGASLVEYALLVALIAIVCIVAIRSLGTTVSSRYSQIASGVASN